jgi:creatinine amidohydrolase
MTWPEIAEAAAGGAILIIPSGSIEQHGYHLPMGTDTLISEGIAGRLLDALPERRIIMAPPLRYTIAKLNSAYPGTMNLNGATLIAFCRDIFAEFLRQGFGRIVILNGHMESVSFIMEGAELALEERGAATSGAKGDPGEPKIVFVNWWEFVTAELIEAVFGRRWPGWEAEHAALTETSLMLHLRPDLVRPGKAAGSPYQHLSYKILPWPEKTRPASGSYADPTGATGDIGRRLLAPILDGLKRVVETEL